VIATYNGENFLRAQLRSIKDQTQKPQQIIIIDDCSQDGTKKIIRNFIPEFPERVFFIENKENLGSKRTFEIGISNCSADYIALCDQDDVWRPEKIAKQYEALEKNQKAQLCFHDLTLMDKEGLPKDKNYWEVAPTDEPLPVVGSQARERLVNLSNPVPGCTMFFSAQLKKDILPVPPSKWVGHDWWISVVAFFYADPIFISDPLAYYRIHSRQTAGIGTMLKKERKDREDLSIILRLERELKRLFRHSRRYAEMRERRQEMSTELLKVIETSEKVLTDPTRIAEYKKLKEKIQENLHEP